MHINMIFLRKTCNPMVVVTAVTGLQKKILYFYLLDTQYCTPQVLIGGYNIGSIRNICGPYRARQKCRIQEEILNILVIVYYVFFIVIICI